MTICVVSRNGFSEHFSIDESPSSYSRVHFSIKPRVTKSNFTTGKDTKPTKSQRLVILSIALLSLATWIEPAQASMIVTATKDTALPTEVDDIMKSVQLICLGLCVGVGIIMAMVAGFFRMIGLREESRKRYMDSITGMIMVLTAPSILLVIASIVRGLLYLMPGYTQ